LRNLETSENDIISVLNFYSNAVFNVSLSHQSVRTEQKRSKRKIVSNPVTLSNKVPKTERGLFIIAGGCLCLMYKKYIGKRHYRLQLKRLRRPKKNSNFVAIVCALRMTDVEKADAPAALLSRDRGGLIVPKLNLLPYIRQVIEGVMQFATSDGIKQHGHHLFKVRLLGIKIIPIVSLRCIINNVQTWVGVSTVNQQSINFV
jgi:hypothetical protein